MQATHISSALLWNLCQQGQARRELCDRKRKSTRSNGSVVFRRVRQVADPGHDSHELEPHPHRHGHIPGLTTLFTSHHAPTQRWETIPRVTRGFIRHDTATRQAGVAHERLHDRRRRGRAASDRGSWALRRPERKHELVFISEHKNRYSTR
ncbi:hypothetical protein ACOMHN_056555 [Nucella lapillus]